VPELQPYARALVDIAGQNGLQPRITSARRNIEEQRELYNRFLRGKNPYPVAPPGSSSHETGEAFDLLVTPVEYLVDLGEVWTSWGGKWGGKRDPVHFQLPGAPSPELLREIKSTDPYFQVSQTFKKAPWWVQKLEPWQLKIYNDFPIIRSLINSTAGLEQIQDFFDGLTK